MGRERRDDDVRRDDRDERPADGWNDGFGEEGRTPEEQDHAAEGGQDHAAEGGDDRTDDVPPRS